MSLGEAFLFGVTGRQGGVIPQQCSGRPAMGSGQWATSMAIPSMRNGGAASGNDTVELKTCPPFAFAASWNPQLSPLGPKKQKPGSGRPSVVSLGTPSGESQTVEGHLLFFLFLLHRLLRSNPRARAAPVSH